MFRITSGLRLCGLSNLIEGLNKANSTDVPAVIQAPKASATRADRHRDDSPRDHQVVKDYYLMLERRKAR